MNGESTMVTWSSKLRTPSWRVCATFRHQRILQFKWVLLWFLPLYCSFVCSFHIVSLILRSYTLVV